jgi:hypothetical protein
VAAAGEMAVRSALLAVWSRVQPASANTVAVRATAVAAYLNLVRIIFSKALLGR